MDEFEMIMNKKLSNGLTRADYLDKLNSDFSQPLIKYNIQNGSQWIDIPYAIQSEKQKLNIYIPDGEGPFPVIIWVHGGGYFMGDRSDFGLSFVLPFQEHGFAVVSVGYRLVNEAVFPDPVKDIMNAISFLNKHAEEYNLDNKRFAIISGSAGTTLASLAGLRADIDDVEKDYNIKAMVLKCPILDFTQVRDQYKLIGLKRMRFDYPDEDTSIEALFLGGSTLECPEKAAKCNPANHLKNNEVPAVLLMHGLIDVDTPYLQSVEFMEKLKALSGGNHCELALFPDTGHDNGMYDLHSTFEMQLNFFNNYLK